MDLGASDCTVVYRATISHHDKIVFQLLLITNHYILPKPWKEGGDRAGDIPCSVEQHYIYTVSTVRNVYAVYLMDFSAVPGPTAPFAVLRWREPLP